jgi:hypothetical protein
MITKITLTNFWRTERIRKMIESSRRMIMKSIVKEKEIQEELSRNETLFSES